MSTEPIVTCGKMGLVDVYFGNPIIKKIMGFYSERHRKCLKHIQIIADSAAELLQENFIEGAKSILRAEHNHYKLDSIGLWRRVKDDKGNDALGIALSCERINTKFCQWLITESLVDIKHENNHKQSNLMLILQSSSPSSGLNTLGSALKILINTLTLKSLKPEFGTSYSAFSKLFGSRDDKVNSVIHYCIEFGNLNNLMYMDQVQNFTNDNFGGQIDFGWDSSNFGNDHCPPATPLDLAYTLLNKSQPQEKVISYSLNDSRNESVNSTAERIAPMIVALEKMGFKSELEQSASLNMHLIKARKNASKLASPTLLLPILS